MRVLATAVIIAAVGLSCVPATDDGNKDRDKDPTGCVYPEAGALTAIGDVMPRVAWSQAFEPDGTATSFDLKDFYCNDAWDAYTSVTFILFGEWCPNCPEYLGYVNENAEQLERSGSLLVFVDLENVDQTVAPVSTAAHAYVSDLIGTDVGLRVGEGDADPIGLLGNADIWSALPGGFVVRRSDMKVVGNQDIWPEVLNYVLVARHLDADWTNPAAPPFFNTCADGDDEGSEPNDYPSQAAPLAPGTLTGGICNPDPDYFKIELTGAWQVDLLFDENLGDLDVYALVAGTNDPVIVNDVLVGGYTPGGPEQFSHQGPVDLFITGYLGSSAPYTLTLTEL